jgi:hypothetical protein
MRKALIFCTSKVDTSTPSGRAMFQMMGVSLSRARHHPGARPVRHKRHAFRLGARRSSISLGELRNHRDIG